MISSRITANRPDGGILKEDVARSMPNLSNGNSRSNQVSGIDVRTFRPPKRTPDTRLVIRGSMPDNQQMSGSRGRGRPRRRRLVGAVPRSRALAPVDPECVHADAVRLTLDEIEALRLADLESIYQAEAAAVMGVSRSTFGRILESARHKMALSLWEGRDILIGGGDIDFREEAPSVEHPGKGPSAGSRKGYCLCPACGVREAHQPGTPCRRLSCPECGTKLVREGGERHRGGGCGVR